MVSEPTLLGLKSMASANKMRRLKYSCEEVYERMDNGLCIFCDELDTPGHHDLKHKGIQIFIGDDDLACNDVEEVHQIHQAVKNPDPFVEPVKNSDALIEPLDCASVLQVLDYVSDVLMVRKVDSHVNEVEESSQQSTNGNDKIVAHQLFDQMPNSCQKDLTVIESSNKEVLSFLHKDARVWEPGGLPTKMDHWDWFGKELKPYGESHKAATFLYSQMQVVKSNPAEFKTFDRKGSNKTLPLPDEQDDEHEQNQVLKLISSWNNRIWEPGGVLIELDRWNWLEKCYNHGILMRLMHWLSSMWWKETKSREFHRLSECSWVDIKTWHFVKHETQQTDFHVWHRWKNKAEKLPADYALLELMMLGLVSFQPNKGTGVVGTEEKLSDRLSLANYVWKPGELLCVQDQWDWISEVHNMGSVLKIMQRFHGLHLQEIISMDMKLREVIVHDVLSVKVFLSVCNRKSEAQLEVYLLEHHNFKIAGGLIYGDVNFHLKHKWRSKVSQSFSELKQRILVSLGKSLGHLMEAHGSKYEGLVCALERKKLRTIENDIDHLKKLLATMEGLAQKISCGLLCGNGKFHLKHKWKSKLIQALSGLQFGVDNIVLIISHVKVAYSVLGLEVFVENVVLFTGPDKLLFSNNHKFLHPEIGFCTQYNHLELLSTEHQSSPGLDYFTYLNFIGKQVLSCGCEAGHISSRIVFVGGVHGLEAQCKRLLVLNEISLLDNDNKVDFTIEASWFYNKPTIREVFHLQRPPELIYLQGNPNFITKVPVQWKEHPPDQFFSGFYGQVLMLSSLRTRMFRRREYCDRINDPGFLSLVFLISIIYFNYVNRSICLNRLATLYERFCSSVET